MSGYFQVDERRNRKMESEMIEALQTIADNIQAASQPGWVEFFTIGISLFSIVVSAVAIWYAVQIPKKIAERQNKIALFEKRYKIYRKIVCCHTFVYTLKLSKNVQEGRKGFLATFAEETLINVDSMQTTMGTSNNYILKVVMSAPKLVETLCQSKFLFADNPWIFEFTKKIVTAINDLVSSFLLESDEQFIQARKKFIDLMNDKMYDKVLDKVEKELQLKNI